MEIKGVKVRWSRLRRFLEAARDDHPSTLMVCRFIDATGYKGFAKLLRFAGSALGITQLARLAQEDLIIQRVPGNSWINTPEVNRETKNAVWVPDAFVKHVSDCCFDPSLLVRIRAFYVYLSGIGGVRWGDSAHITGLAIVGDPSSAGACILFTASRFKTTRGSNEEHFVIPLYDYRGRSLARVAMDLKDHMGKTYLLPAPDDSNNLRSEFRFPKRGISYVESTKLVRLFVSHWQATLPVNHKYTGEQFNKATIHSFKGWLDTLAKQVRFPEPDLDTLLHWSSKKMHRRYDRNPMVGENFLRQQVLAVLASSWESAGLGYEHSPPPVLSELRVVQPDSTFQF